MLVMFSPFSVKTISQNIPYLHTDSAVDALKRNGGFNYSLSKQQY